MFGYAPAPDPAIWRYDAAPRDRYLDALLDAIEAHDTLANRYADELADDLTDELSRIVEVAARAGSTEADIEAALRREGIDRLDLIATIVLAEEAEQIASRTVRAQAEAVVAEGRRERAIGPIRKSDLEARAKARAERGDSLIVRLDDAPAIEVPPVETLARMSDKELNDLARSLGAGQDRARRLSREIAKAGSRLVGAELPDEALVDQVMVRAQTGVRRALRRRAKALVRGYEQARLATSPDMAMRWIAVMGGAQSCPSCKPRHGVTKSYAEWVAAGTPGSANLICGPECNCTIQPARWFMAPSEAQVEATLTPDEDLDLDVALAAGAALQQVSQAARIAEEKRRRRANPDAGRGTNSAG